MELYKVDLLVVCGCAICGCQCQLSACVSATEGWLFGNNRLAPLCQNRVLRRDESDYSEATSYGWENGSACILSFVDSLSSTSNDDRASVGTY